jgi:hypothetical protein
MQPGELIGKYLLVRALGEGGMKQVWRARDVESGADVAVAIVHRFHAMDFRNEVALAMRVKNPHVARVIDGFVTDGGVAVVVSELCDGLDLMHYRQAREVTPGEAVAMVAQMATGIAAIHAAHVLHRDVKPSNAILTTSGVKMIDFGISLPAMDEKTAPGSFAPPAGTLPYMAPEAVSGDVDARLDTYALGVSLFELVVGRLPMPQLGFYEWMNFLVRAEPLRADVLDLIDVRIAGMFERMTEPARDKRPYVADVEAELHALAKTLGGVVPTAIVPPPPSIPPMPPMPPPVAGTVPGPPPGWVPTFIRDAPPPVPRADLVRGQLAPLGAEMIAGRAFRLAVAVPDPGRIVIGWPHLPVIALVPEGSGTRITCFDPDGRRGMAPAVLDDLCGGLVADLDGDGVGELYVWSAARLYIINSAGRILRVVDIPRRAGVEPWDTGAFDPVVLDAVGVRELAVGNVSIDGVTHETHALGAGFEGRGAALVDARGFTGLSCHGGARQRFRGDVGTPAAILARRRVPGFVVASLEREFDGHPTIALGMWGPGGHRVGRGRVGAYGRETAPFEMYERAQQPSHAHFDPLVAPLAMLGSSGRPGDDIIIVPYLQNAPWFGPVLVAFDGEGNERWRERVRPLTGEMRAPPMLVDLDGTGQPQLVWNDGSSGVQRRDARTGAALPPPPAARGVPVAALDLGGRGDVHLINWLPDAIEATMHGRCLPGAVLWLPSRGDLWRSMHGRCLPGAVLWLPSRGDLWRSGTLAPDGYPVGPRA